MKGRLTKMKLRKFISARAGLVVAVALLLSGCTTPISNEGSQGVSSDTSVEREAGWFVNGIKVCVQNATSKNQPYEFNDDAAKSENGYDAGILGVGAFVCADSISHGPKSESVIFYFGDDQQAMTKVKIANTPSRQAFEVAENVNRVGGVGSNSALSSNVRNIDTKEVEPNVTQTISGNTASITFFTDGVLKEINGTKRYFFTVRLYDPTK
jgi:hypothetical protein